MTFEELENYFSIRNEIEFEYQEKQYSITYWYPGEDEENAYISICEFYKYTTEVKTAAELWNDVSREWITVGEMLSSITEEDIYVY